MEVSVSAVLVLEMANPDALAVLTLFWPCEALIFREVV